MSTRDSHHLSPVTTSSQISWCHCPGRFAPCSCVQASLACPAFCLVLKQALTMQSCLLGTCCVDTASQPLNMCAPGAPRVWQRFLSSAVFPCVCVRMRAGRAQRTTCRSRFSVFSFHHGCSEDGTCLYLLSHLTSPKAGHRDPGTF